MCMHLLMAARHDERRDMKRPGIQIIPVFLGSEDQPCRAKLVKKEGETRPLTKAAALGF